MVAEHSSHCTEVASKTYVDENSGSWQTSFVFGITSFRAQFRIGGGYWECEKQNKMDLRCEMDCNWNTLLFAAVQETLEADRIVLFLIIVEISPQTHTHTRVLQVEHDAIGIARHAICGGHMRASELMLDDYFRC